MCHGEFGRKLRCLLSSARFSFVEMVAVEMSLLLLAQKTALDSALGVLTWTRRPVAGLPASAPGLEANRSAPGPMPLHQSNSHLTRVDMVPVARCIVKCRV